MVYTNHDSHSQIPVHLYGTDTMRLSMVSEVPILHRRIPDTPVAACWTKILPKNDFVMKDLLLLEDSKLNDTGPNGHNWKLCRSRSIVWHKLRLSENRWDWLLFLQIL